MDYKCISIAGVPAEKIPSSSSHPSSTSSSILSFFINFFFFSRQRHFQHEIFYSPFPCCFGQRCFSTILYSKPSHAIWPNALWRAWCFRIGQHASWNWFWRQRTNRKHATVCVWLCKTIWLNGLTPKRWSCPNSSCSQLSSTIPIRWKLRVGNSKLPYRSTSFWVGIP